MVGCGDKECFSASFFYMAIFVPFYEHVEKILKPLSYIDMLLHFLVLIESVSNSFSYFVPSPCADNKCSKVPLPVIAFPESFAN